MVPPLQMKSAARNRRTQAAPAKKWNSEQNKKKEL
jgi:hypothetical protein